MCAGRLVQREGEHPRCADDGCGFTLYRNPVPAVSVLVVEEGRFVLCRRGGDNTLGAGGWCLPCGYVDHGEDFLTAARREVREETGLEVVIEGLISTVSNFFSPAVHSLVTVLRARRIGGALRPGDDAVDVGWFAPGDAPPWAFEADRHIVERYFAAPFVGAAVDPDYAGAPETGR